VILANDNRITVNELPPEVARPASISSSIPFNAGESASPDNYATAPQASSSASLRDVERQQIINALEQTGWHRGKAAEILGISPSTLYRRLRDYNLERRG
jgi:transcriptional regulator of acetoin/glycerol metabolism